MINSVYNVLKDVKQHHKDTENVKYCQHSNLIFFSSLFSLLCLFPTQGLLSRGGSRGRTRRLPPPPKIGKNMIFWRKIVIFHTKYPKKFSCLPLLGAIFLSATPNLKSWIRPCKHVVTIHVNILSMYKHV